MPARQPFTALCRTAAAPRGLDRADLHIHTTCSDGLYSPAQVVDLARRSRLAAIAITDHDTLAGVEAARTAAIDTSLEIVGGVEISAEFRGREIHLLGYFIGLNDPALVAALESLAQQRGERFREMVARLQASGIRLNEEDLQRVPPSNSLGRRHLAELLVRTRHAGSVQQAFARYLADGGRVAVPKVCLPVEDAIALVRGGGGVAAWAHPSYDCSEPDLFDLRSLGLRALEVVYPVHRSSRERELRALAAKVGLAVSGGSDCHGPEPAGRMVGACTITKAELEALRQIAGS